MALKTKLTELLTIDHPVLCAPMAGVTGGKLAAAVSEAGGLGLLGGGYSETDWVMRELREAGNSRIGTGFITWALDKNPSLLDGVLEHSPAAIMFSFGGIEPYAAKVKDAGAVLICQVQSVAQARQVADQGADIVIAQGTEAGGHGAARATFPLVPAVRDALPSNVVVVAAGGVGDGRGLAAALMLGADGVLVGTRFYATRESLAPEEGKKRLTEGSGDATYRGSVFDKARGIDWPEPYDIRTLRNSFIDHWAAEGLQAMDAELPEIQTDYTRAREAGDMDKFATIAGEAADLVNDIPPAGDIVTRMVAEAEAALGRFDRE
ncbi:nitronate monooxygenase [Hwanghaeella grinnelliae]|uniref:Nitronate monooxygenase n=1 Tax=Hwanghaeella grinnelliae TaxID=2500179 RepID=A0A3S2VPQ6_9PROT|nr:nitronate monooxygenase [Hwanghaeella grinnelliae]RVU36547.1 nitronate monooxygenase [Hwanghaeella grinnelliae]